MFFSVETLYFNLKHKVHNFENRLGRHTIGNILRGDFKIEDPCPLGVCGPFN